MAPPLREERSRPTLVWAGRSTRSRMLSVRTQLSHPGTGAYSGTKMVTISDSVTGASIYYSIDGGPYSKYTAEIAVSESETIQGDCHCGHTSPVAGGNSELPDRNHRRGRGVLAAGRHLRGSAIGISDGRSINSMVSSIPK